MTVWSRSSSRSSSLANKETWGVLHQHESGSYLANNPEEIGPKITLVGGPSSLTGKREGLAGNPAKDKIHASTPRSPVEKPEIVKDGCVVDPSVSHSLHEESLAVGIVLDVAHRSAETDPLKDEGADAASAAHVKPSEKPLGM